MFVESNLADSLRLYMPSLSVLNILTNGNLVFSLFFALAFLTRTFPPAYASTTRLRSVRYYCVVVAPRRAVSRSVYTQFYSNWRQFYVKQL